MHDEIDGIGESVQDVADQINQILTGTTADQLADSIKQGFEQGYSSIYDFGDTLNDVLKKAMLSAFEANAIKPAFQPLYDELASLASDGLDATDLVNLKLMPITCCSPYFNSINKFKTLYHFLALTAIVLQIKIP